MNGINRSGLIAPGALLSRSEISDLADIYMHGKKKVTPTTVIQTEPVAEVETTAPNPEINVEKELVGLSLKVAEIQKEMADLKAIQLSRRGPTGLTGPRESLREGPAVDGLRTPRGNWLNRPTGECKRRDSSRPDVCRKGNYCG